VGGRLGKIAIWRAISGGRIALLTGIALGLSGCLVSQDPLVAPGEAAFPLADLASAERLRPKGETDWEHDDNEAARRTGSSYIVTHEDGEEMELTLKRIAQNTFIAQSKTKEGEYIYGLLVFGPDRIYEYGVDCPDFNAEEAQRYGIVSSKDSDDCTVSSVEGLAAGYLAYLKKGHKPSGVYVFR
jgi:hypothetical protein